MNKMRQIRCLEVIQSEIWGVWAQLMGQEKPIWRLAFFSRLEERKGIKLFVESISRLNDTNVDRFEVSQFLHSSLCLKPSETSVPAAAGLSSWAVDWPWSLCNAMPVCISYLICLVEGGQSNGPADFLNMA